MGTGASVPNPLPASEEEALAAGFTQLQIDEYNKRTENVAAAAALEVDTGTPDAAPNEPLAVGQSSPPNPPDLDRGAEDATEAEAEVTPADVSTTAADAEAETAADADAGTSAEPTANTETDAAVPATTEEPAPATAAPVEAAAMVSPSPANPIATEPPMEAWLPEYVERKRSCETKYFTLSSGKRMAYTEDGPAWGDPQDAVAMLAIHGVDCGKEAWLLEATPAVRLIAVDRLGFGESDDAPEMYGYEEVTADLEEFIVGIKLEELVVMAHCLGGAIALNLTASSTVGKRIKALGLLASNTDPFHSSATTEFRKSVGVPEAEDEEAQKTYEKQVAFMAEQNEPHTRWREPGYDWAARYARLKAEPTLGGTPEQVARLSADLFFACSITDGGTKANSPRATALEYSRRACKLPNDISVIKCPVLAICSQADLSCSPEFTVQTSRAVKQLMFKTLANHGHLSILMEFKHLLGDVVAMAAKSYR